MLANQMLTNRFLYDTDFINYHGATPQFQQQQPAVAVDPPDPIDPDSMHQAALLWIGFDNNATRDCIQVEDFASFNNLKFIKEKDIRDLAESYGRRTAAADGRFLFGVRRIRYLIGMIHWVQDFVRVGEIPSLAG